MELTFRAATPAERLYTAGQSTQIAGQTRCVGHLRADMGADGKGFFKTWKGRRQDLDTKEFQQEFEGVLNALVGGEQYGGFLKSRDAMRDFCQNHPESGFNDGFSFAFRADTGIRFITSDYKEKFRIGDGDMVRIRCPDGREIDHVCRYAGLGHPCRQSAELRRAGPAHQAPTPGPRGRTMNKTIELSLRAAAPTERRFHDGRD